jgi:hypothetical protein
MATDFHASPKRQRGNCPSAHDEPTRKRQHRPMVGDQSLGLMAGTIAEKQRTNIGSLYVRLCPHGQSDEVLHLGDRKIRFGFAEHHDPMTVAGAAVDDVTRILLAVATDAFRRG